jgi:integrase
MQCRKVTSVQKGQQLLRRLDERRWSSCPQSFQNRTGRKASRREDEAEPPYGWRSCRKELEQFLFDTDASKKRYGNQRTATRRLIEKVGDAAIGELAEGHVIAAQASYQHLKPTSRSHIDNGLKRTLRYLHSRGAPDLTGCVIQTPPGEARTVTPTAAELALLKQAPDLALRWAILCACQAGLRVATACAVTPAHISGGHLRVTTKRGALASLPLSADLSHCMAALPRGTPPTCDTPVVDLLLGRKPNVAGMSRRFSRWKGRCGITRDLTLHDLRRGLARAMYAETGDLRDAQAVLGHKHLASTLHYLHAYRPLVTVETLELAIERTEVA